MPTHTAQRHRPQLIGLLVWILALTPVTLHAEEPAAGKPATAPPANEERPLPSPQEQQMARLAKATLPDTEVLWLETQHESFLGLLQPAISADPKGGVLLLHHDRTSPDWPRLVHGLRTGLPDQGWHTLAIAVPPLPRPPLPARGTDASAAEAIPEPEDYDRFSEQLFQRIESALNQLSSLGAEQTMLVGIGSSGYWAARYAKTQEGQSLLLTLVDAHLPATEQQSALKPKLPELVASLSTPTLDLYHGDPTRGLPTPAGPIETAARRRQDQVTREGRSLYFQRRLPEVVRSSIADRRLLGAIKGLLKTHFAEITKKPPEPKMSMEKKPGQ